MARVAANRPTGRQGRHRCIHRQVAAVLIALVTVAMAIHKPAWAADAVRPDVAVTIEALLLWRNGLPDRPLYFDSVDPATVPLDAAGIGTGMAAGPRYRIDWNRFDDGGLEFNYFNVQSFNGSRTVSSPGGQLEQSNILGFSFPDVTAATAAASGGIKSFELNRRRQLGGWEGDFLYGFRWVEWNDGLRISDTTVSGIQTGADTFLTNTTSSLYGAQIGLDLVLLGSRRDRAWLEGIGKAGVYYDNAVQNSFVDSASVSQITRSNAASAETTSFMGELGFTGCLRLSDHWVARTGFTMFWLGNVAAAADQLAVNDLYSQEIVSRINTGADVFLYGLNLGLEASW